MEEMIMTYAYVQENNVIRTGSLPNSWKNYSNFPSHPQSVHLAEGFYLVVYDDNPVLQLDQYFGPETFEILEMIVRSYKPVITRDLPELKVWVKQKGLAIAKERLAEEYDYQTQIVIINGRLGQAAKTALDERQDYFIVAYQTFAGLVDACTTKAELLVVYNDYPQLQW